jgi:hypothetical protein
VTSVLLLCRDANATRNKPCFILSFSLQDHKSEIYRNALALVGVTEYKPAQPLTNILKWMCEKWLQVMEQTVK